MRQSRETIVGKASSFADPDRKVFAVGDEEIGVFKLGGEFFAWENRCPHLDGPACQGKLLPCTTEAVNDDKTSRGREFSKTQMNVVCPWHGFEFDIRTGLHPTNHAVRLRAVPFRIDGDDIVVSLRARA